MHRTVFEMFSVVSAFKSAFFTVLRIFLSKSRRRRCENVAREKSVKKTLIVKKSPCLHVDVATVWCLWVYSNREKKKSVPVIGVVHYRFEKSFFVCS